MAQDDDGVFQAFKLFDGLNYSVPPWKFHYYIDLLNKLD
jgi:hypothetical protein